MNAKVLANVNGKAITEEDVESFLAGLGQRGEAYRNPQGKQMILEELVSQALFLAEAKKNLFEYEEGFKVQLSHLKDRLLTDYAIEKAVGHLKVTPEEVRKFYEDNKDKFQSESTVSASHILVAEEETAKDLLGKIQSGEMTFEDAAKNFSTCPSGKNGGSLGEFSKGQMVPEFDEACFSMEVGEMRGPVKTQFGFHLIRLDGKKDAAPVSFDEVKDELEKKVLSEKQHAAYQSKINQLKILFPVDRF